VETKEESKDFSNPQKNPSPKEKGWRFQGTLLQAEVLILRLSRRLQLRAAPAPKMGNGPGTDAGPGLEGVKTRESTSTVKLLPNGSPLNKYCG
jgi:hypothetical protein